MTRGWSSTARCGLLLAFFFKGRPRPLASLCRAIALTSARTPTPPRPQVYDVSSYVNEHPGGRVLLSQLGEPDSTGASA